MFDDTIKDIKGGGAYIIHPVLNTKRDEDSAYSAQSIEYATEEAKGLARAIQLDIQTLKIVNVSRIQAGAFLGKGQREIIGHEIELQKPDVVIFNHTLSPIQQRNLEKEWNAKVIDRTGLILEIFAARAQTKEGGLQVELAAMQYQRSRLVRTWTHLERQRGSTGFIGGPGETQIEIDRRLIRERIAKLKKELEKVRKTRNLAQKGRKRIPLPVIALVGYTNAGKSTLFNHLTGAKVMAEDLLFATLDPTMRKMKMDNNQSVILSDTVGFISNLPTHLVESFKATLEHINQADVIVHVRDVSNPAHDQQADDVKTILESLGIEYESDKRIIEVMNKADSLEEQEYDDWKRHCKFNDDRYLISAQNGQGIDTFLDGVSQILTEHHITKEFKLSPSDGKTMAWLYDHGDVIERDDKEDGTIVLTVTLSTANRGKFNHYFDI